MIIYELIWFFSNEYLLFSFLKVLRILISFLNRIKKYNVRIKQQSKYFYNINNLYGNSIYVLEIKVNLLENI